MNKKKLLAMLTKKEQKRAALVTQSDSTESVAELRSIQNDINDLNTEIAELRSMIDALPDEEGEGQTPPAEQRQTPQGQMNPMGTYLQGQNHQQQQRSENEDPYGTLEYRQAFMQFATTGIRTPSLQVGEARADAMTNTGDVSAVIPSTILNEVVKKLKAYGQIYKRVRKLNIKGGVTIPILSLKPTASWISETKSSDKQKVQANQNISFSYYGLECKVSTSLLADTTTLAGFESVVIDVIYEAMIQAIEHSIIKGDGAGKAQGITNDTRVSASQTVVLSPEEFASWDNWKKKVFAKMPLKYKAGASFLMASGTFEGYIDGMVDANGQPIGRVNYGITDGPQERFGGKEVIQVEDDIIAPYDDANDGDVVAIYVDLANYGFNSNLQMTMYRYFDHDTNEWVDKAILIADGKLIDPHGVVIVKKGAPPVTT